MNLFKSGAFVSHAGLDLRFKIDCDVLTDEDIKTLAAIIARNYIFHEVHGIPRGGLRLAASLQPHCSPEGEVLIVDDVLTTGSSMEEMRRRIDKTARGIVIFARGTCPEWISPIFQLSDWCL